MGLIGAIFLVPIFAETFLGYDATQTGYLFIPLAMRTAWSPRPSAAAHRQSETLICDLREHIRRGSCDAYARAASIRAPRRSRSSIPMSLMAFGLGFGMSQRTNLVAVVVPHEEIGEASAILALVEEHLGRVRRGDLQHTTHEYRECERVEDRAKQHGAGGVVPAMNSSSGSSS